MKKRTKPQSKQNQASNGMTGLTNSQVMATKKRVTKTAKSAKGSPASRGRSPAKSTANKKKRSPVKKKATAAKPRGRPKIRLTNDQKQEVSRYARAGVPIDAVADLIGISESTLWRRLREDKEFLTLYNKAKYQATTNVAGWLYDNCSPETIKQPIIHPKTGEVILDKEGNPMLQDVVVRRGSVAAQRLWLLSQGGWKNVQEFREVKAPEGINPTLDDIKRLDPDEIERLADITEKIEQGRNAEQS